MPLSSRLPVPHMPFQQTIFFINLNHENQPEKTNPPLLSSPTPDLPAISLHFHWEGKWGLCIGPGCSIHFSALLPPQTSPPSHVIGLQQFLISALWGTMYKDQHQIEKAQWNGGTFGILAIKDLPSTASAVLHGPVQPLGPVGLPIVKLPAIAMGTSCFTSPPLAESTVLYNSVQT